MGNEKSEAFINYLDSRTSSVQENIQQLTADNRKDEANFEKIRANIFQIIKTIFQTAARISEEESKCLTLLGSRLTIFQETWEESLAKAKEHDDAIKVLQEQTKLEALAEIQDMVQKIWG